jgi:hypothetical protein
MFFSKFKSARIPNPNEDPTLADKEAILASLNIKAMEFEEGLLNNIAVQRVVVPSQSSIIPLQTSTIAGSGGGKGAFSLLSQVTFFKKLYLLFLY